MKTDRRNKLRAAGAKVCKSMSPEFRQMSAVQIMALCVQATRPRRARSVAGDRLSHYDGSVGFIVDSNVWIDCMDAASPRNDWAIDQVQICSERPPLHDNLSIYVELLVPEPDVAALDAMLDVNATRRSSLPWACAALAAKAFGLYSKRGGARRSLLPDFYIGVHAAVVNISVLTRDALAYESYFPRIKRVCPV